MNCDIEKCRNSNKTWEHLADGVKTTAAHLGDNTSQMVSALGQIAGEAVCELGNQTDSLVSGAGATLKAAGTQLDQQVPPAGMLVDVSHRVAESLTRTGAYLQDSKLSGLTNDLTRTIRRNPIKAIVIAAGLGWLFGRGTRN